MNKPIKVWHFMKEFAEALEEQLRSDDLRWGDTWLDRTITGQTERTEIEFMKYFDQYKHVGKDVNWLAVAGNAMICWIRTKHPEMFKP